LPQDQTITFGALGSKAFGDAPFAPAISASSGLLVTLSAAGKCSASGATVRLIGVGQCTVTANQSGNANWRPAAGVSQSFDISKGQQAITFPNPGRQVYRENLVIQLQATASSGLPVSYEVSQGNAACYTVEGTTVPIRYAGGTCYIRASQPGNDNWLAASPVEVGFEVVSGRGQIQWNQSLSDRTFPPATSFDVTARTIHGELPHFEATGSCDVTEKSHDATSTTATVTTTGIGTCTVTARQPDNQSWFGDPAGIPKTFRINPAPTPTPAKL